MEFLLLVLIAMTVVVLIRVVASSWSLPPDRTGCHSQSFRQEFPEPHHPVVLTGVIFCFAGLWLLMQLHGFRRRDCSLCRS